LCCTLLFFSSYYYYYYYYSQSSTLFVCFAALNGHARKICTDMYWCYFKGNNRNS